MAVGRKSLSQTFQDLLSDLFLEQEKTGTWGWELNFHCGGKNGTKTQDELPSWASQDDLCNFAYSFLLWVIVVLPKFFLSFQFEPPIYFPSATGTIKLSRKQIWSQPHS